MTGWNWFIPEVNVGVCVLMFVIILELGGPHVYHRECVSSQPLSHNHKFILTHFKWAVAMYHCYIHLCVCVCVCVCEREREG